MTDSDDYRAGYAAALADVKAVLGGRQTIAQICRSAAVVLAMEAPLPPLEVAVVVVERRPEPEPPPQ